MSNMEEWGSVTRTSQCESDLANASTCASARRRSDSLGPRKPGGAAASLTGGSAASIDRPEPRRRQFDGVSIRVADVETFPAPLPPHPTLDGNAGARQSLHPRVDGIGCDREGE